MEACLQSYVRLSGMKNAIVRGKPPSTVSYPRNVVGLLNESFVCLVNRDGTGGQADEGWGQILKHRKRKLYLLFQVGVQACINEWHHRILGHGPTIFETARVAYCYARSVSANYASLAASRADAVHAGITVHQHQSRITIIVVGGDGASMPWSTGLWFVEGVAFIG